MGNNLPPGVSVGDLPGSEPPPKHRERPPNAECAVCGKPLRVKYPDTEAPHFCDEHDAEDLAAKAEQEHLAELERRRERYFDRHGHF